MAVWIGGGGKGLGLPDRTQDALVCEFQINNEQFLSVRTSRAIWGNKLHLGGLNLPMQIPT